MLFNKRYNSFYKPVIKETNKFYNFRNYKLNIVNIVPKCIKINKYLYIENFQNTCLREKTLDKKFDWEKTLDEKFD